MQANEAKPTVNAADALASLLELVRSEARAAATEAFREEALRTRKASTDGPRLFVRGVSPSDILALVATNTACTVFAHVKEIGPGIERRLEILERENRRKESMIASLREQVASLAAEVRS